MRVTFTLRQRLYLLTAIALAPAIFLLGYNEFIARAARTKEVQQSALRIGEQASLEMQRVVSGAEAVLLTVARAPSVRSFSTDLCVPFIRDILTQMPQFTSIGVADRNGVLRCRDVMPAQEVSVSDRTYFKEVMKTGAFYVGAYQKSLVTGEAHVPVAIPVRDGADAIIGVAVGGLSLKWLDRLVSERAFGKNEALTIADRDGTIIARHPFPEKFVGTRIPDAFLPLVTAPEPGTREVVSQDGARRIIGYYPVGLSPRGLYVSAGIGFEEAMKPVVNATRRGIFAIVIGAILAFVFATLIGNTLIRRPLGHIIDTVDLWRSGNSKARTRMDGVGEIAMVGSAIDRFMEELELSRAQRQLVEEQRTVLHNELEHRVKNTLATVRAIAAQTFRGSEMQPALGVFGERLMALGRAYDQLRGGEWRSANLKDTVTATTLPYRSEQFDISGPDLRVGPRATLSFSMALHELATNAAKYGALGHLDGRVSISWKVQDDEFSLVWREQDGPPVIPPSRTGFGTRLIEKMLAGDIGGKVELNYLPAGLCCRIDAPMERLTEESSAPPETASQAA